MTGLLDDLRIALRQHLQRPGFAATVVGTLALTVGATTAVFSVVETLLVRALPYAAPERLVWIASVRADSPSAPFTLPEYMDYRGRTRTLAGLAAYANWSASLATDGSTERLTGARMSANAFDVLGMAPAAGRLLNDGDDRPEAPRVAVLSHRLWQRLYGGSADVVGKAVRINAETFAIVGVLPAHFPLPMREIDVVTPLSPERDPLRHARGSVNFLRFFGRLDPAADAARAQAELSAICGSLRQQFPLEYARKLAVSVVPLHEAVVGDQRQPLLLLLGAVVVVLLTALANLASLALVRAAARRGELSLRVAIGASPLRLAQLLAVDGLLLALLGGVCGWLLAAQAIAVARVFAPPSVPRMGEVSLDGTAALFVAVLTLLVTALLTSAQLGPLARARALDALRSASRGALGDRASRRVRRGLVASEIAAALILLLAASVFVQNLRRLQAVQLGFAPDRVFQARVSVPSTYRTPEDVARFYERLADRLAAAPGVTQLGVVSVAPLSGLLATIPFSVADRPAAGAERPSANLRLISPGYPSAVGTRMLQGRPFSEDDAAGTPRVALVSAALAERFLQGGAVGQRLLIDDNNQGPRAVEIVGVLENVRQAALDLPPALDIYLPLRQLHPDGVGLLRNNQFWMLETDSDPAAFSATFLAHVRAVDLDAAVSGAGSMRQYVDAWLGPRRFTLGLFAAFALTAVLLAVSGVYGLVAYAVSQRVPEIGLRMALGATRSDVRRMVLRQSAGLGLIGAATGLALALALRPLLSGMVQDARLSPALVGSAVALLMVVVLAGAWLPARRAARIEPTLALKGP